MNNQKNNDIQDTFKKIEMTPEKEKEVLEKIVEKVHNGEITKKTTKPLKTWVKFAISAAACVAVFTGAMVTFKNFGGSGPFKYSDNAEKSLNAAKTTGKSADIIMDEAEAEIAVNGDVYYPYGTSPVIENDVKGAEVGGLYGEMCAAAPTVDYAADGEDGVAFFGDEREGADCYPEVICETYVDADMAVPKMQAIAPKAGILRAGQINDCDSLSEFKKYSSQQNSFWDFSEIYYKDALNNNSSTAKTALDLMFVLDTTGSMGDELNYLQEELADVIMRVKDDNSQLPVNFSVNFYRDHGDQYVVKSTPFTKDVNKVIDVLRKETVDGGGDFEEAVELALEDAIVNHQWSTGSDTTKLMFLVLDAPPHSTEEIKAKILALTLEAANKGIVILPVASSGIDQLTEHFLRQLAAMTGGTYQFLTDNSYGIGGEHLAPTDSPDYEIKPFNDLIVEIINNYLK